MLTASAPIVAPEEDDFGFVLVTAEDVDRELKVEAEGEILDDLGEPGTDVR